MFCPRNIFFSFWLASDQWQEEELYHIDCRVQEKSHRRRQALRWWILRLKLFQFPHIMGYIHRSIGCPRISTGIRGLVSEAVNSSISGPGTLRPKLESCIIHHNDVVDRISVAYTVVRFIRSDRD